MYTQSPDCISEVDVDDLFNHDYFCDEAGELTPEEIEAAKLYHPINIDTSKHIGRISMFQPEGATGLSNFTVSYTDELEEPAAEGW